MSVSSVSLPAIARAGDHSSRTQQATRIIVRRDLARNTPSNSTNSSRLVHSPPAEGQLLLYEAVANYAERQQIEQMFAVSLYV